MRRPGLGGSRPGEGGKPAPARRRRYAAAFGRGVALVCAFAMAGCGLPGGGPVVVGRAVDENVVPQARIVVPAPEPGASPEQIVRGFLLAGAAFQETTDRAAPVAAGYLASDSVQRWRPTSSVTVFDRSVVPHVEVSPGGSARVSVVAVATVDEAGRYRELAPGTLVEASLGVVQEAGEWRVVLPDTGFGVWLNTDDFGRLFDAYRLSYAAVGVRRIVSDVRWFPLGPRLATALARAQLGAVPDYLKGAAETAIPEGTRLAVDAVSVDGGVATVVLTATATSTDAGHRAAMWAQFVATLVQVPGVHAVSLEVQGSGRLAVQDVRTPVGAVESLGFSADVVATPSVLLPSGDQWLRADPARLDETTPAAAGSGSPQLPNLPAGASSLAVSADLGDVAGLSASGTLLRWHGGATVRVDLPGGAAAAPAYDARARLWVGAAGQLWTLDASRSSGAADPLDVTWLAGRTVVALAPSPDATRLAVISSGAQTGDSRLDVAGIVRDQTGRPTALAKPYRQGEPLGKLASVAWVSELTLAVLGAESVDAPVRPYVVGVGQGVGLRRRGATDPRESLIVVAAGAKRVVCTGGLRGIVVVTEDDRVKVRSGGVWRVLPNVSDLLVPPARLV